MDSKDAVADATTAPSIPQQHPTNVSDPTRGNFAFLVHSQDTLTNNLPPNADNQPLTRQKRRRTSPEDHTILEAEYKRNPKPDKAARVAIVNRVALGEKEVQIWFQNRRQMTRRKSRPLSPEEIMASLNSSQERISSTTFSSSAFDSSQRHATSSQSSLSEDYTSRKVSPEQTTMDVASTLGAPCAEPQNEAQQSSESSPPLAALSSILENVSTLPTVPSATESNNQEQGTEHLTQGKVSYTLPQPSIPSTVGLGYLANRRNAPFVQQPGLLPQFVPPTSQSINSPATQGTSLGEIPALSQPLKRTSSHMRLSMSLDGKAQVTTDNGSSPSPPRSQPLPVVTSQRPSGLQRSKSAVASGNPFSPFPDVMPLQVPRRSMTGRSRDARTWEFYCDSDARNALTEQAEQEQSGSAIGAIGLIRSRSNKALSANPNKRNAQAPSNEAMKRVKPSVQRSVKPKLARTTSSVARLQSGSGNVQNIASAKEKGGKPSSQPTPVQGASGDSDKENWEPGTQTSNLRRARAPNTSSQARRAILKDSAHIPSHSTSLDALLNQENITPRRPMLKTRGSGDGSDEDAEEDQEVAAFMGCSSLPREEEDLNCVQNLLSLSQGAWR